MDIKQAIDHLEELKIVFNEFEMIESKEEDIVALNVAIETMTNTLEVFNRLTNALSLFNVSNDIINKKSTCHCCSETENLIDVLDMPLCPVCLGEFDKYRKMIDKIR